MSKYILGQQPPLTIWKFDTDKNQLSINTNDASYSLNGSSRNKNI